MKNSKCISIILASLLFVSCAGTKDSTGTSSSSKKASADSAVARGKNKGEEKTSKSKIAKKKDFETEYRDAQRDFQKNNLANAVAILNSSTQNYQDNKNIFKAYNLLGLIYFKQKNYDQSEKFFTIAMEKLPQDSTLGDTIKLNIAHAKLNGEKIQETFKLLNDIDFEKLDLKSKTKYQSIKMHAHLYKKDTLSAANDFSYFENTKDASKEKDEIKVEIEKLIEATNKEGLESILQNIKNKDFEDDIRIKLAKIYATEKDIDRAKSILIPVTKGKFADDYFDSLELSTKVNRKVIGALLPLSGKYERFGNSLLQAMTLALGDDYTLAVEDIEETPEKAVAAFTNLVKEKNAICVIGPPLRKQAIEVSKKAQSFSVPLINIAQIENEEISGNFIFRNSAPPKEQIKALMSYFRELGYTNFSIFHPEESFGFLAANSFWDLATQNDFNIKGYESYPQNTTDYRDYIRKLYGLSSYSLEFRKPEIDELASIKATYPPKEQKKLSHLFTLKPIVDVDAIFIPATSNAVSKIAPTLKFESVNKIPIVGLSTLNTEDFIKKGEQYVENSVFVDVFNSYEESEEVQNFKNSFSEISQGKLPTTNEALAFDSIKLIEQTLQIEEIKDRLSLRNKLASTKFKGITGNIDLTNNSNIKTMQILSIKAGKLLKLANYEPK